MNPLSDLDILIAAKALIEDPEDWCQGVGREDHKRCAATALRDAAPPPTPLTVYKSARGYIHRVALWTHNMPVTAVNDNLGHAAVMRMYDKAIEMAKEAK